ncbi:MAG: hypothetical protein KIT84_25355 [Labilithrix sp.]|nr:hypothetical protein [Labilithrix sp.]MCW5814379.1 hypothetical protein [Labilithrix sp.]
MAALVMLFGVVFLVVAWRGHRSGELPAGSKGFQAYRPNRHENPIAFHFFLCFYVVTGVGTILYGLASLIGVVDPIPLR